jgi:hypothetical protein
MALNFPTNPQLNAEYTAGDSTWTWDGTAWNVTFDQISSVAANAELTNVPVDAFRVKSVVSGLSTVEYAVTISAPQTPDIGNKYNLNTVYRPILNLVVGYTYVFNQDDATNVYFPNATGTTVNPHPLNFSADNLSGELGSGTSYLNNVRYFLNNEPVTQTVYNSAAFNTATSRQVHITVTNATPATLYYWCYNHTAMGNEITVIDPGTEISTVFSVAADDLTPVNIDLGETVQFIGGAGISTATDADGNITISNSFASATAFVNLAEADVANLTIDQIYEPAIAVLRVDNVGTTAYTFNSHYTGNNPTIFALAGTTIAFHLAAIPGLPFQIQDPTGVAFNSNLVHVAVNGTVSTGSAAQNKDSGTLYWRIPESISGNYRYQCSSFAPMVGAITIKRLSVI